MVQTKILEKKKTHILFILNHAIYETMWKNIVELDWPQITMWHTHIAFWIPKAKNTHLEYVILIFPLQQWLYERASVLCCMYIACLFYYVIVMGFFKNVSDLKWTIQ